MLPARHGRNACNRAAKSEVGEYSRSRQKRAHHSTSQENAIRKYAICNTAKSHRSESLNVRWSVLSQALTKNQNHGARHTQDSRPESAANPLFHAPYPRRVLAEILRFPPVLLPPAPCNTK